MHGYQDLYLADKAAAGLMWHQPVDPESMSSRCWSGTAQGQAHQSSRRLQ